MIYRFLLALGALLLVSHAACTSIPPLGPTPPAPSEADCGAVCDHWRQIGCSEADPSPDGEPCEAICESWRQYWDTGCMATVDSCEAIDGC